MKTKQQLNKKHHTKKSQTRKTAEVPIPFVEHLYELRKRLIYVVASILIFSTLAYFVQQYIVGFLLRPSKGQQFIYTSPVGGVSFLFTVCTYVGIAASTPVIIYQLLGFFEPLIKDKTRRSIIRYSCLSSVLAIIGFGFGYYIGLPVALHFLSHQFTTKQIHPLFTIQEYMSFLLVYLLGSAALFQLPIILLFINRIRPLPPRKLLKAQRYVIAAAFIIAMIMAPTPNILDQLIIAGPIILIYNLSVLMIWLTNRHGRRPKHIVKLLEHDYQVQISRQQGPRLPLAAEPLEIANRQRKLAASGRRVMDVRLSARPGRITLYPQT